MVKFASMMYQQMCDIGRLRGGCKGRFHDIMLVKTKMFVDR